MVKGFSDSVQADLATVVMQALREVAGVDGDLVTVRQSGAVVHLTGYIANHRAKQEAEQAAAQTPGVRHVVNELRVASPLLRSDDQLVAEMGAALRADPLLHRLRAGVDVRDGVVFLLGEAGSFRERFAAEERAWSVRGVLDVHNRLTLPHELAALPNLPPVQDVAGQVTGAQGLDDWRVAVNVQHSAGHFPAAAPAEEPHQPTMLASLASEQPPSSTSLAQGLTTRGLS